MGFLETVEMLNGLMDEFFQKGYKICWKSLDQLTKLLWENSTLKQTQNPLQMGKEWGCDNIKQ